MGERNVFGSRFMSYPYVVLGNLGGGGTVGRLTRRRGAVPLGDRTRDPSRSRLPCHSSGSRLAWAREPSARGVSSGQLGRHLGRSGPQHVARLADVSARFEGEGNEVLVIDDPHQGDELVGQDSHL